MEKQVNELQHLSSATELCLHNILDFGHIFNKDLILSMLNQKLEEEQETTPITVLGLMHGIIDYYHNLLQTSTKILSIYIPDIVGLGILIEQEGLDIDIYNPDVDIISELYARFSFENTLLVLKENLNDIRASTILDKYTQHLVEIENMISPTLDYFLDAESLEPFVTKKNYYFDHGVSFVLFQHELMIKILSARDVLSLDEIKDLYLSRIKDMVVVNIEDIDLSAGQYKN